MRDWNLKSGSYVLAADARLSTVSYTNDQIWELSLNQGEPQALALSTTYGLRARSARIFPRFIENELSRTASSTFAVPPAIQKLYPNFAEIVFSPFTLIQARSEIWVASSQLVVGRISIKNQGESPRSIRVELAFQLNPESEGERALPKKMGVIDILAGKTSELYPVLFMTAGPEASASPYPSLQIVFDLKPGETRQITWAQAAYGSLDESFEAARKSAARNFDAERARIELTNAGWIDILTADPEWDKAFALAQRTALNLLINGNEALPNPSFVLARQPDHGYSRRGDGRDYPPLWTGQPAWETFYLANLLLPSEPTLAAGLLQNYLHIQAENGRIDGKPGLGGQRSQLDAAPLLATLAWKLFQVNEDENFLRSVYPHLLAFYRGWFLKENDRDQDGIPEWAHPTQTGLDDHPIFAYWNPSASGIDITTVESPALCSLLYKENRCLVAIATRIGCEEDLPDLEESAENLRSAVEISWDSEIASYRYWDRDSHYCSYLEDIGERPGSGDLPIQRNFPQPVRLLFKIKTHRETTPRPTIYIHGTSLAGQHLVEKLGSERFHWYDTNSFATSERIYTSLEKVDIQGLGDNDLTSVQIAGYETLDISLLLPLWAHIPAEERVQSLVEQTLLNPEKFWFPAGIPACAPRFGQRDESSSLVHLPWNVMIGEGLVSYGYRKEAAELVMRLMKGMIENVKSEGGFRRAYHAETGRGSGERNALEGLAPLGLFLEVLGITLISPKKLVVSGNNPFPWPVTVRYRGLTILKQTEKTTVIFSDGQTVVIDDPATHTIINTR